MLKRPVYAELSLRGEIENVLQREAPDFERGYKVRTAWSARTIAKEVGSTQYRVTRELHGLMEEGYVTRRRQRDGTWLWKLVDAHHDRWQALRGPGMVD